MSETPAFDAAAYLTDVLERRLDPRASDWLGGRRAEVAAGLEGARFAGVISVASRYLPRGPLHPDAPELARAAEGVPGWNPERWSILEAGRVALVLARPDLALETFTRDLEDVFRHADEGELRALYRCLCLLPDGARFAWRAREGCRTNIRPVFEAVACDTPYPATHFDDVAWNQLVIKAVFIGAPLWRVRGLDERLSPELARMALDLADERRSAGRAVQPELWLCLGAHGGARALASIEREIEGSDTLGRRAAAVALVRAERSDRLAALAAAERDPALAEALRAALEGPRDQTVFRTFHES